MPNYSVTRISRRQMPVGLSPNTRPPIKSESVAISVSYSDLSTAWWSQNTAGLGEQFPQRLVAYFRRIKFISSSIFGKPQDYQFQGLHDRGGKQMSRESPGGRIYCERLGTICNTEIDPHPRCRCQACCSACPDETLSWSIG